jgi:hypothetical protein
VSEETQVIFLTTANVLKSVALGRRFCLEYFGDFQKPNNKPSYDNGDPFSIEDESSQVHYKRLALSLAITCTFCIRSA